MKKTCTETEGFFPCLKFNIFYRHYRPEGAVKQGILFVHGKNTHSLYFENIISRDRKCLYFTFDYPGQGRSCGRRGDLDTFKYLPLIIREFYQHFIEPLKLEQVFIVGESLGSLAGFYAIHHFKLPVTGFIFCPGVFRIKEFENPLNIVFLLIAKTLFPRVYKRNKRSISQYTTDRKKMNSLKNDPHYCPLTSMRYLWGIYKLFRYFQKKAKEFPLPVLIFQGARDYYSTPQDARSFLEKLPRKDKNSLVVLDKSRHWLMLGEDTGKIACGLYDWIDSFSI